MRWHQLLEVAAAWRGRGLAALRSFSPYAWIPVLTIASLSLLVSFCNYRLQTSGRPELQFTNGDISQKTLIGYWHNTGKMIAWSAKAKLFDADDAVTRADQPFADIEITGAGPKIFPGFGAQMSYTFPSDKLPRQIFVCATYFDENQKLYQQVFFLVVQKKQKLSALMEQVGPIKQNCS